MYNSVVRTQTPQAVPRRKLAAATPPKMKPATRVNTIIIVKTVVKYSNSQSHAAYV